MFPLNLRATSRTLSPVRFNPGGGVTGTSSAPGSWAMLNIPGEEKETMRCLNGRLKEYLDQVKLLEEANTKLETQIKQVLARKRSVEDRDWSGYQKTINGLRQQFQTMVMENTKIMLQIDNARLATEDFKVKLESESVIRQVVELDIASLRKVIDDTHLSRMHLEGQIESLREELICLRKAHEEDVTQLKIQIQSSGVNVQMEANMGVDLTETIDTIRLQYERAMQKSQVEAENWYKEKFNSTSAEVSRSTDELEQGKSELNEMYRQKQGLEIDLQTMHSMVLSLEETLQETAGRYALDMNNHNAVLQRLEAELGDVHAHVTRQRAEYQALLNIKCKLEEEIATYRRLLEGIGMENFDITDAGFRQNEDLTGFGSVQDPPSLPNNADVQDGDSLAGYVDESVEFSLDQALYANPPLPTFDQSMVTNETVEEEMNATNSAMNLQCSHEVTSSHDRECPVIMGMEPPEMIPLVCPLFKEYRGEVLVDEVNKEEVVGTVIGEGLIKDRVDIEVRLEENTLMECSRAAEELFMGSNEVDRKEITGIVIGDRLMKDRVDIEVQLEENAIVECSMTAEELTMEPKMVEEEKSIVICAVIKEDTVVMEVQEEENNGAAEEQTVGEEKGQHIVICAAVKQEINPPISLEFQQEINTFVEFNCTAEEEAKTMVESKEADEEQKNSIVVSIKVPEEVLNQNEGESGETIGTVVEEEIRKGQVADEKQINNIVVSIKVQEEVHIQEAGAHETKISKLSVEDYSKVTYELNEYHGEDDEMQMMKSSGVEDEEIKVVECKGAVKECVDENTTAINRQEDLVKKVDEEQIKSIMVSIKVQQEVHVQDEAHDTTGTVVEDEIMKGKEADEKITECRGVEENIEVNGGAEVFDTGMNTVEENRKVELKAVGQEESQSIAEWMGADKFKNEEQQNN